MTTDAIITDDLDLDLDFGLIIFVLPDVDLSEVAFNSRRTGSHKLSDITPAQLLKGKRPDRGQRIQ
jgi:hypothetical protein